MTKNIAIFASGSGTNAEAIIQHFTSNDSVNIMLILSNKPDAYIHQRAKKLNIPSISFTKTELSKTADVLNILQNNKIDFIILAGFLLKVPANLITAFPNRIVNIHPALLPKYGGKGMYGSHVHEAIVANKEKESGITIHYVNENYDEGNIIFQAKCEILATDTAKDVAEKIHQLEHKHFPIVIEDVLNSLSEK